MKKKISIAVATILSFACLPFSLQTQAEEVPFPDWNEKFNFEDCNFVVSGILYDEEDKAVDYIVTPLNASKVGASVGYMWFLELDEWESVEDVKIGDLFSVTNGWICTLDICPAVFQITGEHWGQDEEKPDLEMKYLGNGIEFWGDEFGTLIRNQVELFPFYFNETALEGLTLDLGGLKVVKGDATEDETVDILDVITVNKAVLGKEIMQSYASYVSDVNANGEVDANDSLEIMKYVVGLTDTLD